MNSLSPWPLHLIKRHDRNLFEEAFPGEGNISTLIIRRRNMTSCELYYCLSLSIAFHDRDARLDTIRFQGRAICCKTAAQCDTITAKNISSPLGRNLLSWDDVPTWLNIVRNFQPGDSVLVFLPVSNSPMHAQFAKPLVGDFQTLLFWPPCHLTSRMCVRISVMILVSWFTSILCCLVMFLPRQMC